MSQCYKCQREIPDGQTECEPFCWREPGPSDEEQNEMEREYLASTVQIDWDKVEAGGFKALILILKILAMIEDRVDRDSPEFEKLKPFLKDEPSE